MTGKKTIAAIAVGMVVLAGGDTSSPAAPGSRSPVASSGVRMIPTVAITEYQYFIPVSVPPGATILVTNASTVNHTITSTGRFNVTVTAGASAAFTAPTTPGTYRFTCAFHPGIVEMLVVG